VQVPDTQLRLLGQTVSRLLIWLDVWAKVWETSVFRGGKFVGCVGGARGKGLWGWLGWVKRLGSNNWRGGGVGIGGK
jgi:hypothetical protein